MEIDRRDFGRLLFSAAASALVGCGEESQLSESDVARLEAQRREEAERSGRGPYGPQRYRGYRGLAALPWFELDADGQLRCVVEDLPPALDVHAHLGISVLLAPAIDLQARTTRVQHLLDCDAEQPGCALDLDVYINANFTPPALRRLRIEILRQALWPGVARTHTIPNLLSEMDGLRVERALLLPIAFGLPFGDDLSECWMEAIEFAGAEARLLPGASVHPRDPERIATLRRLAARGARAVQLHPGLQRVRPDAPESMEIYEECTRLGLPIILHAGRAGIEPAYSQQFNLMRHYVPMLRRFPEGRFVLGHAGARDLAEAVELARRHPNAWLDVHGQGVSRLHELIERLGGERLMFGSDWPFYHQAATLAKVLMVTEGRPELRRAILRDNAERLLSGARAAPRGLPGGQPDPGEPRPNDGTLAPASRTTTEEHA